MLGKCEPPARHAAHSRWPLPPLEAAVSQVQAAAMLGKCEPPARHAAHSRRPLPPLEAAVRQVQAAAILGSPLAASHCCRHAVPRSTCQRRPKRRAISSCALDCSPLAASFCCRHAVPRSTRQRRPKRRVISGCDFMLGAVAAVNTSATTAQSNPTAQTDASPTLTIRVPPSPEKLRATYPEPATFNDEGAEEAHTHSCDAVCGGGAHLGHDRQTACDRTIE